MIALSAPAWLRRPARSPAYDDGMARRTRPVLTLVAERKLSDLITPPKGSSVLEASGVVAKDGHYYVVFDNIRRVARVLAGLEAGSNALRLPDFAGCQAALELEY